ncbi:hypothetical protein AC249_AIPGENE21222 [Exaiptasia diaphana]|nr:hypothetical protein AC249_AIPGENE21222 [Exaiptasia diaphana]
MLGMNTNGTIDNITFSPSFCRLQESSSCGSAWYQIGNSCFIFITSNLKWIKLSALEYNRKCAELNSLPVNSVTVEEEQVLSSLSKALQIPDMEIFIGVGGNMKWQWIDGTLPSPSSERKLKENNRNLCGAFSRKSVDLIAVDCSANLSFICEQLLDFPNPVALYPLNASSGANEISLDPLLKGEAYNMVQPDWLNESYYFPGLEDSYIAINHNGNLDLMKSITITAWIFPQGNSGFIVTYGNGTGIKMLDQKTLVGQLVFEEEKEYKQQQLKLSGLKNATWNFIGISYDFLTGHAKLFIGDNIMSRRVGNRKLLATNSSVEIASSFKGGISRVQFYDVSLNDSEIIRNLSSQMGKPKCNDGFVPVRGRCFYFSDSQVNRNAAYQKCRILQSRLAIIDTKYVHKGIASYVHKGNFEHYFIGLKKEWSRPVSTHAGESNHTQRYSLRMAGYNDIVDHRLSYLGICKKNKLNRAFNTTVISSNSEVGFGPKLAVDGMLETCFISSETNRPYLRIMLKDALFIHEVHIISKDCCKIRRQYQVTGKDVNNRTEGCVLPKEGGSNANVIFKCIPLKLIIELLVASLNWTSPLLLCEVQVFSIDDLHGVTRNVWLSSPKTEKAIPHLWMKKTIPDLSETVNNFNAPQNFLGEYVQLLSTYVQV